MWVTNLYTPDVHLLFSCHPSYNVKKPWWPHSLWKQPTHTHIFLVLFWTRNTFCSAHLCHTKGINNCNHTVDTMYPCINYREGECFVQLCLLWIPKNRSLWIPVPPDSLYFSDVRFTTWTYPSLVHADIWLNTFSVLLDMLLINTPIFS